MKKTRREFSLLSGLGLGAAVAGGAMGRSQDSNETRTVRVHQDPTLSCFEVNLARGRGSELVATFGRAASGSETGDIVLTRSFDGGTTWRNQAAPLFSHPGPGHHQAGIVRLSDGALIASTTRMRFLFDGKLRWRRGSETDGVYVRESRDGGYNWGDVRKVETAPFGIAWTRGPIVEMADGSLLLPISGQRGERYGRTREAISSFTLRSLDRGASWSYHGLIAADHNGVRDYDEPAMINLGDGRLLCMLRSHESPRRDPPGGYLYTTISHDAGATWSKAQKTSMWGHPAHLLRLDDGRILCTYGYRMHPNPGVLACVSKDGVEWKPQNVFRVKSLPNLDSDHLQIGCPSSVELDDGRILTAYQVWMQERQGIEGALYRV